MNLVDKHSEELVYKVVDILGTLPKQERFDWLKLPCTQALLLYLKSLHLVIYEEWANGTYTSENVEGTAQLNANMIGKSGAIEEIFDWIKDIPDIEPEENPEYDGE